MPIINNTTEGYVYLIGTPVFGWYKIGKSKTPDVRVQNLGILLPFKIHIIGVWKAQNYHLMEKALHEMYRLNQINGEWFEFTKNEVYAAFGAIPAETRIYPNDNSISDILDKFSNISEDTKNSKRVIGVRVQKLRGDLSAEERDQRRQEGIARKRQKKSECLSRNMEGMNTSHPSGDVINRLRKQAKDQQQQCLDKTGNIDILASLLIEAADEINTLRSYINNASTSSS